VSADILLYLLVVNSVEVLLLIPLKDEVTISLPEKNEGIKQIYAHFES
jgi:hypothetical protein